MEFRRNGLRDERRRRVLIDETLHGDESPDASTTTKSNSDDAATRTPTRPYSEAAVASTQVPISFLLPKHPFLTWSVLLAGLGLIGVIEILYCYVFLVANESLRPSLVAFDVTARGSLASWFGSVVLGVSAFGCMLVYQVRRHRTDDYRGRYRLWMWLMPLLLLLSVCVTTGLHQAVSGVMTAASGAEVAVGGKGWWLMAFAAILVPLVPQLALEMWPSRLATSYFAGTMIAYAVVALFELHFVQLASPLATTVCHTVLLSTAHLGLLVTVLAYGRYVYLDAHGRLGERRKWIRWPKRKKRKAAKANKKEDVETPPPESAKANTNTRIDQPHTKFGQDATPARAATIQREDIQQEDDEDENSSSDRKLSKAERRRLRRDGQTVVNQRGIR